jgi:hypothetical protein
LLVRRVDAGGDTPLQPGEVCFLAVEDHHLASTTVPGARLAAVAATSGK